MKLERFFLMLSVGFLLVNFRAEAVESAPTFFSIKINVTDLDRSLDFYTKAIGLQVAGKSNGTKVVEVLLTRAKPEAAGKEGAVILVYDASRKDPLVPGNAFNNITFNFPDLKEVLKRFDSLGIKYTGSSELRPSPTPMAKQIAVAFTKDPDGYTIELLQRKY